MNTWPDGRPVSTEDMLVMAGLDPGPKTFHRFQKMTQSVAIQRSQQVRFEMWARGELDLHTQIWEPS